MFINYWRHVFCFIFKFFSNLIFKSFGLNHPDLEYEKDSEKKDILIKLIENKYIANQENCTKITVKKQIYGYIFVYDVTEKKTLEFVKKRKLIKIIFKIKEYIDHINECEEKKISGIKTKKFLVGNKIDLLSQKDRKDAKKDPEVKRLVETYNLTSILCSAMENQNIDQIFEDITRNILSDIKIELVENNLKDAIKEVLIHKFK